MVELTSPIYKLSEAFPYEFPRQINTLFNIIFTPPPYPSGPTVLQPYGEDDIHASTHVHISPASRPWSEELDNLKKVAYAIIHFERCTDALMPATRLADERWESNRTSVSLISQLDGYDSKPSMDAERRSFAYNAIQKAKSPKDVVDVMCTLGWAFVKPGEAMGLRPQFRWNLLPVLDGALGSIEFRQVRAFLLQDA
jgi:hypothetical protein